MTFSLSIIMPTWNGASFLQSALDSVICQNEKNLEIIAVDDGSVDSTPDILESYTRKIQLKIIRQPHTGNWAANTNIGFSIAQGEYVSFLHQDDIWLPNRFKILKEMTEKEPDTVLFLHPSYFIDTNGKKIGIWKCPFPDNQQPLSSEFILPRLLVQNFISIPSPCFKRKAAVQAGLLDERLWYTADWKLWTRLALIGKWIYYPYPLTGFRIHPTSLTAKGSENLTEFRHQIQTIIDQFLPELSAYPAINTDRIKQIADFSMSVNTMLATLARGQSFHIMPLLKECYRLGIKGLQQYIEYSRITERVSARIKAGLTTLLI